MKITASWKLPDEQYAYDMAMAGQAYHAVLQSVDEELRRLIKHDDSLSEETKSAYEQVRTLIYEKCEEEDVEL